MGAMLLGLVAGCSSILGIGELQGESVDAASPAIDAVAIDASGSLDAIAVDAPAPDAGAIDASLVCGDGTTTAPEACDDGNAVTETACAYGTATCAGCDSTCTAALSLTGNVCNDGARDIAHEACDDGSPLLCPGGFVGTRTDCNPNCQGTTVVTCGS